MPPTATEPAPLAPPAGAPAALALFAAAAARNRFAPLGRFTRVSVVAPAREGSRSTRRRNGLGRFSSSCKSYVGAAAALLVRVRVLLDDEEDDGDDDDEDDEAEGGGGCVGTVEKGGGAVVSRGSEVSAGALARVREDTDGRRRRRAGWEGGAGAERVGKGRARDLADAPTDLRFDGDLFPPLTGANVGAEAGPG